MHACMTTYRAFVERVLLDGDAAGAWFLPLDGVLVWVQTHGIRQQGQSVRLA